MIAGIGTDIIEIKRIKRIMEKSMEKSTFIKRCFSQREIEYFETRNYNVQTIAGAFASKEAFSKSVGQGLRFPLKEVEILHDKLGKPYINTKLFTQYNFHLTISHTDEYAVAFVVAEYKTN